MATKRILVGGTPFTQEEIDVERNRRKCLKYQQEHREKYREYQRKYSAEKRNELKNIRYRLALRISNTEKKLELAKVELAALDQQLEQQRDQADSII